MKAEAGGRLRSHQHALVVDGDDRVERGSTGERDDGLGGRVWVVELQVEGSVAHGTGQRLTLLRRHHHVDIEGARRVEEVLRTVRGGGEQQEDTGHGAYDGRCDEPRRA